MPEQPVPDHELTETESSEQQANTSVTSAAAAASLNEAAAHNAPAAEPTMSNPEGPEEAQPQPPGLFSQVGVMLDLPVNH